MYVCVWVSKNIIIHNVFSPELFLVVFLQPPLLTHSLTHIHIHTYSCMQMARIIILPFLSFFFISSYVVNTGLQQRYHRVPRVQAWWPGRDDDDEGELRWQNASSRGKTTTHDSKISRLLLSPSSRLPRSTGSTSRGFFINAFLAAEKMKDAHLKFIRNEEKEAPHS